MLVQFPLQPELRLWINHANYMLIQHMFSRQILEPSRIHSMALVSLKKGQKLVWGGIALKSNHYRSWLRIFIKIRIWEELPLEREKKRFRRNFKLEKFTMELQGGFIQRTIGYNGSLVALKFRKGNVFNTLGSASKKTWKAIATLTFLIIKLFFNLLLQYYHLAKHCRLRVLLLCCSS